MLLQECGQIIQRNLKEVKRIGFKTRYQIGRLAKRQFNFKKIVGTGNSAWTWRHQPARTKFLGSIFSNQPQVDIFDRAPNP